MRRCLASTVIVVAVLVVIIAGGLVLVRLWITPDARRASGGNDFFAVHGPSMRYAEAHEGRLPPLDAEPGRLMIDRRLMMDEFGLCGREVTADFDPTVPADQDAYSRSDELRWNADLIDDHSWWYLGYSVRNEDEGRAFVLGYLRAALMGEGFGEILPVPESTGLEPVRRLSLDLEILRQTDSETGKAKLVGAGSTIPFLIERPGHYPPYTGGWVCYLDGRSEFIEYPGKWPMTKEFIAGLEMLDRVGRMMERSEAR